MGKHIMANAPFGYLLNSWMHKRQYDIYKGPYLCAKCDNETFSSWESYYASTIWKDPLGSGGQWGDERIVLFALSVAYRYTLYFLETSPVSVNRPYNEWMRDLLKDAMRDPAKVGSSLFLYPYAHQEMAHTCKLLAGVNHLLQLAVYAELLPQENDLPNAMLVLTPKIMYLYCDRDITLSKGNEIKHAKSLKVGQSFDAASSNTDMPIFLKSILNRLIGQSQGHQRSLDLWMRFAYGADKLANPQRLCYLAYDQDKRLSQWQRENRC
jgi:hypothetical protein